MARVREKSRIGVYGDKTRNMQRQVSYEAFQLTFKTANVYRYLGSRVNVTPDINDVQTIIFSEVPDRAYDDRSVEIHIGMEPLNENMMDFSQYGIINPMGNEIRVRVHVNDFHCLGRAIIVGDALEIPFFRKDCDRALFEVTDVDDKPSYEKFYYTVSITPMEDSRSTREVTKDRSNQSIMDDMRDSLDERTDQDVPFEGLDDGLIDSEFTPPTEEVDYRNKKQSSFLDDESYVFTGENE